MGSERVGWYLFFLGLAAGIVVLDMAVYRKLPSRWLRWMLLGVAVLTMGRYLAMALFAQAQDPRQVWGLHYFWFASSFGLTLPSVLVLDQLLRHPSWSAAKVLRYFTPFLVIYLLVILCGRYEPARDAIVGWHPTLVGGWRILLSVVQSVFVLGFVMLCALILLKMRSPRVRVAVGGLLVAHLYLGLDGLLLATGHTYFRPFLYSEILALAAIGHAFDTALQRAA